MADWDRKELLDISYAILRCMNSGGLTARQHEALSKVYEMTRAGSRNVRVTAATVENVKQALCEVCTTEGLYGCNEKKPCTGNCEFYKANYK